MLRGVGRALASHRLRPSRFLLFVVVVGCASAHTVGRDTASDSPVGAVASPEVVFVSASRNATCVSRGRRRVLCWGQFTEPELVTARPIAGLGLASCWLDDAGTLTCGTSEIRGLGLGDLRSGLFGACVLGASLRCTSLRWGDPVEVLDAPPGTRSVGIAADIVFMAGPFGVVGSDGRALVTEPALAVVNREEDGCASLVSGGWSCWGRPDADLSPHTGTPPSDLVELAGGAGRVCGRDSAGSVYCWGRTGCGAEPGSPPGPCTRARWDSPAEMALVRPAIRIVSGTNHTCALLDDDSLWCWGSNFHGQLGDGTREDSATPVRVVLR